MKRITRVWNCKLRTCDFACISPNVNLVWLCILLSAVGASTIYAEDADHTTRTFFLKNITVDRVVEALNAFPQSDVRSGLKSSLIIGSNEEANVLFVHSNPSDAPKIAAIVSSLDAVEKVYFACELRAFDGTKYRTLSRPTIQCGLVNGRDTESKCRFSDKALKQHGIPHECSIAIAASRVIDDAVDIDLTFSTSSAHGGESEALLPQSICLHTRVIYGEPTTISLTAGDPRRRRLSLTIVAHSDSENR